MTDKLLPCPFCGKKPITEKHYVDELSMDRYAIICKDCLMTVPHFESMRAAIKKWNTRPIPTPKPSLANPKVDQEEITPTCLCKIPEVDHCDERRINGSKCVKCGGIIRIVSYVRTDLSLNKPSLEPIDELTPDEIFMQYCKTMDNPRRDDNMIDMGGLNGICAYIKLKFGRQAGLEEHKCKICDRKAIAFQEENGWRCPVHICFGNPKPKEIDWPEKHMNFDIESDSSASNFSRAYNAAIDACRRAYKQAICPARHKLVDKERK